MIFSTKQYSWSSVKVFMWGKLITGLRGIEYTTKTEKEYAYGGGNEPQSIQSGNKSYEGNIMVLQSELIAMQNAAIAAGYSDITDVPGFDIQVSYANKGEVPRTDSLIAVEFTEEPDGMKQGDKFSEHTLPIMFLRKVSKA